jgi:hypothetical protein
MSGATEEERGTKKKKMKKSVDSQSGEPVLTVFIGPPKNDDLLPMLAWPTDWLL